MSSDPYYLRNECSNSDLSDLNKLLNPDIYSFDYTDALRFGTLLDCMITEMEKVNVWKRTVDGEDGVYSSADFELARQMKIAFYRDPVCAQFMKLAECQKVSVGNVLWKYGSFKFSLRMRCKWDLFMTRMRMGADIKTTTATTDKQFLEACHHFKYFRSRAVYMELENTDQDMLIGVSKVNQRIFKIPIRRGDKLWQLGYDQACDLSLNYYQLFEGFNEIKNSLIL